MTESVSEVKVKVNWRALATDSKRVERERKLAEDVEESHFTTGQEEEELSVQTAALVVVVAGLFVVLSD